MTGSFQDCSFKQQGISGNIQLFNGFTQTFPPMRLKAPGRAVQAIVNPGFPGIFVNVDVSAIVVRPGELENVAANLSSHLRC